MDDKDIGVKEFGRGKSPEATSFGRADQTQSQLTESATQNTDSKNEIKNIRSKLDDEIENEGVEKKQSGGTPNKSTIEQSNSILQEEVDRRGFLKKAAGAATLIGAALIENSLGKLFTGKGEGKKAQQVPIENNQNINTAEEVQNASYSENDVKKEEVAPPTDSENENTESFEEILFPNFSEYTDDEQYFLVKSIEDERNFYIEKNTKTSVENIASDILVRREQVNQICDEEGIEESSFLREALLGMIFVESKNEPGEENEVSGATGLLQILPSTAEQYGVTKEELLVEEDNIRFAVKYMKYLYDLFPDPGLAVWAYHAGQGNMAYLTGNYLKNHVGLENGDVSEMLNEESKIRPPLARQYIEEYGIDFKKLIKAKDITNIVETEMHDESEKYTFRVGAALSFIEDVKEV